MVGGPAKSTAVSRVIILALDNILRTAKVETEDFVGEIQALHLKLQATIDPGAHLRVHLEMRVEIVVAADEEDDSTLDLVMG